ncbi:carbohydrate ABC transporter permease [Brachybacterium hainanense]|uniref:Carbohydrate ABC transporter permease n=1 Tax=Brachybacterium hainanense TaxID=1541174 RepID=A0ABV6R5U0_9MICO
MTTAAVRATGKPGIAAQERRFRISFLLPALTVSLALVAFPIVYTLYMSTTAWSGTALNPPRFTGFENFAALVEPGSRFLGAAGRTVLFTAVTVVVEVAVGYVVALALRKPFRGDGIVRTIALIPVVLTPVAVAMAWMLILDSGIGLAPRILELVGISGHQFLSDPSAALGWLMVIDVWQWTPMMVLILLAGLTALPEEPFEAAEVDGASPLQRFFHITVPLMLPVMFSAIMLRLVDSLKTFDIIYATTKGGPGFATETLNTYAFVQAFEYTNFGSSASVVVGFILIVVAITASLAIVQNRAEAILR